MKDARAMTAIVAKLLRLPSGECSSAPPAGLRVDADGERVVGHQRSRRPARPFAPPAPTTLPKPS